MDKIATIAFSYENNVHYNEVHCTSIPPHNLITTAPNNEMQVKQPKRDRKSERGGAVVSCHELASIDREGYATSFHELQVYYNNGGNGRGCRELPFAAIKWRRWGEEGFAES